MTYKGDRNGIARQVKGREPRTFDGWRSGSSGDTAKQEKTTVKKEKERMRLVQVDGNVKPVPVD